MTEQEHSLPQNPDNPKYTEGLEFLTDSLLMAEAQRDLYESKFIFQMARGSDYAKELFTPSQEQIYIDSRITSIKLILTSSWDAQAVLDGVDMNTLAKEMTVETSQFYEIIQETLPVENYQAENIARTTANIVSEGFDTDQVKNKRSLIKRFTEAKKIADENNISVEDVFNDQALYFQVIRKSISPEEIITTNMQVLEGFKKIIVPLNKHIVRSGTVIANVDDESVTIDEIDKQVSNLTSTPRFKEQANNELLELEGYLGRVNYAAIERYWGKKTAQLFK